MMENTQQPTVREPGVKIQEQTFPTDFDSEFKQHFPAPEPRKHQKDVVKHAVKGFVKDDKDVVLIDAPPGFGKSITIYTILSMLDGNAYYATPLKSLQEQLTEDEFIGDSVVEIMGRANYPCILDSADPGVTVDEAKCQRDDDFECDIKDSCPYYSQKARARASDIAVQNMAYLMSTPITMQADDGQFSPRDVGVIDECQNMRTWAMNKVGLTVSKIAIPSEIMKNIEWPKESKRDDYDVMVDWLRSDVLPAVGQTLQYLESQSMVDTDQHNMAQRLKRFEDKVSRFLQDEKDHIWECTYDVDIRKNADNLKKVEFKPLRIGRFLDSLLWSNFGKIILASATIPKGDWLDRMGLGDADVLRLNLPSEFPLDNRPIVVDESVGKMTYEKKHDNMPDMVKRIKQIAEHHDGEKGIVHCRGYNYIKMFKETATNQGYRKWFKNNVHIQDRERREDSLEEWFENDKQIFLSVNMAEGIDLKGDKCRWQVLLKAKYPSMNDEIVKFRLNDLFICGACGNEMVDRHSDEVDECTTCGSSSVNNDWDWYNQQAIIQLEQAYGRAVRSSDDEAVFYILDKSAKNLIQWNKDLFHDWFLEAVQW